MKIKQVEYGRTINMGNYESVKITLTAEVLETESWKDVLENLEGELLKLEKAAKKKGY